MSHTLRFSAFIAMVMLSFALAFHAVFHTCGTYVDPDGCDRGESDDFPLRDAFGSFGDSFVTVFSSALGGPDFELFDDAGSDCRCNLPQGARSAGISLMVVSASQYFEVCILLAIEADRFSLHDDPSLLAFPTH